MKTILSILAAALTLSLAGCNTYLESSESIYGDYVCTQLIVESDGAPRESVIDECRLCSSAYVGQRVVVEPESYLLWIGFSAEQGGHFTQVKPNRYTSGKNVKAAFGNSQLVIDCNEGGYQYRIICQKM